MPDTEKDESRRIWVNINPMPGYENAFYVASTASSRAVVDRAATPERVACIAVDWRMGQGL